MTRSQVECLPEELLLNIFECLTDDAPPSELKARHEPSLQLTSSAHHVLKDVSRVSKRWRRLVLPLLFTSTRLRLDIPLRSQWSTCAACSDMLFHRPIARNGTPQNIATYHQDMVEAIQEAINPHDGAIGQVQSRVKLPIAKDSGEQRNCSDEASTAAWALRFYHVLYDFLAFIQGEGLEQYVRKFVLLSGRMVAGNPHQSASRDWRYPGSAMFWQHLLSVFDLARVVIVAPPTELACLTNAAIDTFGDWAFTDMEYHIFELRQEDGKAEPLTKLVDYSKLKPFPPRHPSFASSSLLHLRPWTHVSLNEGSFLKAYGTYEFFERGPPSLVSSIKQCLAPIANNSNQLSGLRCLPALRTFTYTAIFPFANHADFIDLLPHLEELDVQFAPDPQSKILDDKARTGKAELQDCWQELMSLYHDLTATICTYRISEKKFPHLLRFICRDSQIRALQGELDEIFTPLCLPVWVEREPGFFIRAAMSAQYPDSGL